MGDGHGIHNTHVGSGIGHDSGHASDTGSDTSSGTGTASDRFSWDGDSLLVQGALVLALAFLLALLMLLLLLIGLLLGLLTDDGLDGEPLGLILVSSHHCAHGAGTWDAGLSTLLVAIAALVAAVLVAALGVAARVAALGVVALVAARGVVVASLVAARVAASVIIKVQSDSVGVITACEQSCNKQPSVEGNSHFYIFNFNNQF